MARHSAGSGGSRERSTTSGNGRLTVLPRECCPVLRHRNSVRRADRPANGKSLITDRAKAPRKCSPNYSRPRGRTRRTNSSCSRAPSANIDVGVSYLAVAGKADFGGGLCGGRRTTELLSVEASLVEQNPCLSRREWGAADCETGRSPPPLPDGTNFVSCNAAAKSKRSSMTPFCFVSATRRTPADGSDCGPKPTRSPYFDDLTLKVLD